jgi:hypothetical protein
MFELVLIFGIVGFAIYATKGSGNTPNYPNSNADIPTRRSWSSEDDVSLSEEHMWMDESKLNKSLGMLDFLKRKHEE